MWAMFSLLLSSAQAGPECSVSSSLSAGISTLNNTDGAGSYCATGNSSLWLEYTGTCIGQAQICIQSNDGQCITGNVFNLLSNSFYSDSTCENVVPRHAVCEDNDSIMSPSCALPLCDSKASEFVSFPTIVGTKTKLVIASENDTATGSLRINAICDPRKVMIDAAPSVVTQGEIVQIDLTTDDPNPIISLYSDVNCFGVALGNQFFDCGRSGSPVNSTAVDTQGCTGTCGGVNYTVDVPPGVYYWFGATSKANYPQHGYASLTVLSNCQNEPTDSCCQFCNENLGSCPGVYSNLSACQLECREWLEATPGDLTGDSAQCRLYWSTTGFPSDCNNTASDGGGQCIPSCDAFCRVQAAECLTAQFVSEVNCTSECASWPQGSRSALQGNSLSCRWNQLVNKQKRGGSCADTGLFGVCTDTLNPTSQPSNQPTQGPQTSSNQPTNVPSSQAPTMSPTLQPSHDPTLQPSHAPTLTPTWRPTASPSPPTTAIPTRAPSLQACPAATLANFYRYCADEDFVGTGNCKTNGRAPCNLVCRLYSETLEKQLGSGVGACPRTSVAAFAECAASCITRAANSSTRFSNAALTCMNTSLKSGIPMCGFGAIGSAHGLGISFIGLVLFFTL